VQGSGKAKEDPSFSRRLLEAIGCVGADEVRMAAGLRGRFRRGGESGALELAIARDDATRQTSRRSNSNQEG